jgi:hypothetical protein
MVANIKRDRLFVWAYPNEGASNFRLLYQKIKKKCYLHLKHIEREGEEKIGKLQCPDLRLFASDFLSQAFWVSLPHFSLDLLASSYSSLTLLRIVKEYNSVDSNDLRGMPSPEEVFPFDGVVALV